MMRGPCTKKRYGMIPAPLLDYLTSQKVIEYNVKNEKPTYRVGEVVEIVDDVREKLVKPVYRSMPVSFKIWYDKIRYKA